MPTEFGAQLFAQSCPKAADFFFVGGLQVKHRVSAMKACGYRRSNEKQIQNATPIHGTGVTHAIFKPAQPSPAASQIPTKKKPMSARKIRPICRTGD
jgi:hypothetical protein